MFPRRDKKADDGFSHSPVAIEQYPCVSFPRPFELGAGSKLFVVSHVRRFAIRL